MTVNVAIAAAAIRPVRFVGTDREFWRILLHGAVLLIVTLGLYRFWLITDIRRYLWANTQIEGRSLEYAGTAIELLHGFLVAFTIIVPIYVVYFVAALNLSDYSRPLTFLAIATLVLLSQYGIYLARRYRLTRTLFRGLRFHQSGSAFRYSVLASCWWSVTVLTLGLAYPVARAAIERFKMRNTWYGDLPGRFEAAAWPLFRRLVPMWLAVILPALATLILLTPARWNTLAVALRAPGEIVMRTAKVGSNFADIGMPVMIMGLVTLGLAALLLPRCHAMILRWRISGVRFGGIAARSHLPTGKLYGAYLRFAGCALIFAVSVLIAAYAAFALKDMVFDGEQSKITEATKVVLVSVFFVVSAFGMITLYRTIVRLAVWRCATNTIELAGDTSILLHVRAQGEAASPLGEGIADMLNVGGL